MAGAPFAPTAARPRALFRGRVAEVVAESEQRLPVEGHDPSPTEAMTALRATPFEPRRTTYSGNRLQEQ